MLQTPKGFPSRRRPDVLRVFYKNGHRYKKNYGLEAEPLGAKIMGWWEEVGSGSTANVRFGGPTGVYNFVVLMCWWCSLLEGRPDNEHADCLRTLDNIDRAILSAIHITTILPPVTTPSPAGSSRASTTPPTQPRGSKRTISEESSSRKRLRAGQA